MRRLQAIILTRDPIYSVLLEMTIREHEFSPRLTASIDVVEKCSTAAMTAAWFIDLDQLALSVEEVAAKARKRAPDVKLVFLSSAFNAELAQACMKQGALALLVKPVSIPRLIQALNLLRQEMELLETDDIVSPAESAKEEEHLKDVPSNYDDHPFLRVVSLKCPICHLAFEALRFKLWTVPISDTDTDFCPICPNSVHPEMYTAIVCPGCLFSFYVGKFEQVIAMEARKTQFLTRQALEDRKKIAFNLEFKGERTLLHGIKSFELAAVGCQSLKLRGALKLAGEFFLKCSWLCRRMGHAVQEKEAQKKALDCLTRVFAPYRSEDGKYPSEKVISMRQGPGLDSMNERGVIVTGFLAGELSRRLGLLKQARTYFDEVLALPFLHRYTSLLSHVHFVARSLHREMEGPATPP